jgi:hypothetical protein
VLSQIPQAVRRSGRRQCCVADGGLDAVVSVGDDQLDAAQLAVSLQLVTSEMMLAFLAVAVVSLG